MIYLNRREQAGFITLFSLLSTLFFLSNSFKAKETDLQKTPIIQSLKINRASNVEWSALPRMNSYLVDRVIKYKNYLGGYHAKEQLLEVYGMDTSIFQAIQSYVEIDSTWHQFDLNKVEFKVLLGHPYFDYDLVKAIFNYRNHHKGYDSLPEIKTIHLVNDELYGKIAPYLRLTND